MLRLVSFVSRFFYYTLAHIPLRLAANIVFYLACFSLFMHYTAYYIEQHPQRIQKFIKINYNIDVKFDSIKTTYNLVNTSMSLTNVSVSNQFNRSHTNDLLKIGTVNISFKLLESFIAMEPVIKRIEISHINNTLSIEQNQLGIGTLIFPREVKNTGFTRQKLQNNLPDWLFKIKKVVISDVNLKIVDDKNPDQIFLLDNIIFQMKNSIWQHFFSISSTLNHNTRLNFTSTLSGSIDDKQGWNGRLYLSLSDMGDRELEFLRKKYAPDLPIVVSGGDIDLKFWSDFTHQGLYNSIGQVNYLNGQIYHSGLKQDYIFDSFSSAFTLENERFFLHKNNPDVQALSKLKANLYNIRLSDSKQNIDIDNILLVKTSNRSGDDLQIYIPDLFFPLINPLFSLLSPQLSKSQEKLQASGVIKDAYVKLDLDSDHYHIQGRLERYQQQGSMNLPNIKNLSANFWMSKDTGVIQLDSTDTGIFIHSLFRQPWQFSQLNSLISWQKKYRQYYINLAQLEIHNEHLNIKGEGDFILDPAKPNQFYLQLNAHYEKVNGIFTPLYLPVSIMSKPLVNWLDHAFTKKSPVPYGGIVFRGRSFQFPFEKQQGLMDIVFNTKDVGLNYYKNWPQLDKVNARIQFTETGMSIVSQKVQLGNAASTETSVNLVNYKTAPISIDSTIKAPLNTAFSFLKKADLASPELLNQIDSANNETKVEILLKLLIPTDSETEIESRITSIIHDLQVAPPILSPVTIEQLNGIVEYTDNQLSKLSLKGKFNQEDVLIEKTSSLNSQKTELLVKTRFDSKLFKSMSLFADTIGPYADYFKGSSQSSIRLSINNDNLSDWDLNLSSDLNGMEVLLPLPLTKNSDESKPLFINLSSQQQPELSLGYDNLLIYCSFYHRKNQWLLFQEKTIECQPQDANYTIQGNIDLTGLEQWKKILAKKHKTALSSSNDNYNKDPIIIDVDIGQLKLPELKSLTANEPGEQLREKKETRFVQNWLIRGRIDAIVSDKDRLGSLQFSIDKELPLKQSIKLTGDLFDYQGDIQYFTKNNETISQLENNVNIHDTGKLLNLLGYYDSLKQAPLSLKGILHWPGGILDFDFDSLYGQLKLKGQSGKLIELEPGAGRVLGFLNLNNITKNLNLRLNNLSQNGYTFNSIEGDLLFNQGILHTRNFSIDSDMAVIYINGLIGLNGDKINESIIVYPQVSSSLTYAGLAIGGPAGGAIGWLGQKLIGDELNKLGRYQYHISGNWKDPFVKLIETVKPPSKPAVTE